MSQHPSGQEPDHRYTPRQQKTEKKHLKRACTVLAGVFALLLLYGGAQLILKQRDTARTEALNQENRALLGTDHPAATAVPAQSPLPSPAAEETPAPGHAGKNGGAHAGPFRPPRQRVRFPAAPGAGNV